MGEADQTFAEGAAGEKPLAPGAQLGRFTLRRVLGEGGMGVVWAAHDPDLDREIAIKLLRHHAKASDALRKRLLREARAMARLKHPNVITVYEVGTSGDTDFIAMELVEGRSMDEWLGHDPPRDDVWAALVAAGRGLAAAHAAGLVHRDFKPHNVLRSREGRVLVTDFGLARGLGEDVPIADATATPVPLALEVTLEATPARTPSRTDSLLDSPLTQTGAMIGTPAYMAPEQFHGAPPDPRTDQFAYCITVWQALTGARPFHGDTLEELRNAANRGVEGVVADIAKPVRAVLTRGLDRDPARRWPDMDALLDELERARKPRPRVWPLVGVVGAVALAINIFVFTREDDAPRAAAVCAPAEQVFAEAWSDAARAELSHLPAETVDNIARAYEQFRGKWTASYQQACNAPPSKVIDARLACLRGVRDQAVAMRLVLREARRLDNVDVHGSLPNLAGCNSATPVAPPEVPADQPRRGRVFAVLGQSMALRRMQEPALSAAIDKLVGEATAAGWKPLVPMVQVVGGNAQLANGAYDKARVLFRAASANADIRFQALARIGLLEASVRELEKPSAATEELTRLFMYARSAVKAAGNDPILAGSVAMLEAQAKADAGLWSRYRQPYKAALELVADARKEFEKADDLQRAAQVAAFEANLYLWRGNDRALDDALYVARSAEERLANAGLGRIAMLDELRAQIAFARGEYREAHERFDRIANDAPPRTAKHTGRVTDRSGAGVKATVVVWHGELHGDPLRIYTDPRIDGDIIETNADGTFEYDAGDAMIAEAGALRSAPRAAVGNVTLVVEPTSSVEGTIAGVRAPLVDAVARYSVGRATYFVHAPIREGAFRLERLPAGAHSNGVRGPAGHGTRQTLDAARFLWPAGMPIEVILRAPLRPGAQAWIFRGKVAPKTRADAEALAAKAADVATTTFHAVGADATEAGRETYEAGDQHAIVIGNAPGEVTVCVIADDVPAGAPVFCSQLTVEDDRADDSARVLPVLFKT